MRTHYAHTHNVSTHNVIADVISRKPLGDNALARMLLRVPTFGENVRRIREAKGEQFDRRWMAEQIGVKPGSSVVADIESDRHDPKLSKVLRVAKALKLSVDVLLEGVDAEYESFRRVPTRHTGTGELPVNTKAGANVPPAAETRASERIKTLEHELAAANRLIRQFRKLADSGPGGKTGPPPQVGSRGRRGH